MHRLGIDWESIKNCMAFERKETGNTTNMGQFFQEDRDELLKHGITLTPALVINDQIYTDELKGETIFRTICQSYPIKKQPEVCREGYDLT